MDITQAKQLIARRVAEARARQFRFECVRQARGWRLESVLGMLSQFGLGRMIGAANRLRRRRALTPTQVYQIMSAPFTPDELTRIEDLASKLAAA